MRRSVFDEGLHHTAATHRAWSHHQKLVLLHSLEEGSHVGPYCLRHRDHPKHLVVIRHVMTKTGKRQYKMTTRVLSRVRDRKSVV